MKSRAYNNEIKCVNPFVTMDKERNPLTVLIIGNGFDLDLGMHTSYNDFTIKKNINNNGKKYWPFDSSIYDEGLGYYLNNKIHTEKWLDLENELANYALSLEPTELSNENTIRHDKDHFNVLTKALKQFIQNEQDNLHITEKDSAAMQLLSKIVRNPNYFIHTFNYTDIVSIARKLELHINSNRVEYMHGNLSNNDIIIGTGENKIIPDQYDFLYKTSNKHYASNNLAESLDYAERIIIFGHSLGENDFDYFKPFFQKISQNVGVNYNSIENKRLELTIYTRNEESEIAIKRQLRKLTDNHLQGIYANCDFKIEYTKP